MSACSIKVVEESDSINDEQSEDLVGMGCPGDSQVLGQQIQDATLEMIRWVTVQSQQPRTMLSLERQLIPMVFQLGRLFIAFYLCLREEVRERSYPDRMRVRRQWYRRRPRIARTIGTFFGKVRHARTYYHPEAEGSGFHPLDQELGLSSDRFSLHVVSLVTRLCVQLPYKLAVGVLSQFLGWAPAIKSVEQMVLGLGAYTQKYFDTLGVFPGDGDVLVIQIDSKGIPTATAHELRRRRGKRRPNPLAGSARHRGRHQRRRWEPKRRRKRGDKSKNARMATLVVMYTLKADVEEERLLGPLNKVVYASFASKRHAFVWARRMAERRGFAPGDNRLIQFVSDGDKDFRTCLDEYFKDYADHELYASLDLMHVMEYLWAAGTAKYLEGSDVLAQWAATQKTRLLESRADLILAELKRWYREIPRSGPGNKNRRERIKKAIRYIEGNIDRIDYQYLVACDLELGSGAVEGAVNHVIGIRFDHGGMRWIRERAEALLQLRCIELNGQWDEFIDFVQEEILRQIRTKNRVKLLSKKPSRLPTLEVL